MVWIFTFRAYIRNVFFLTLRLVLLFLFFAVFSGAFHQIYIYLYYNLFLFVSFAFLFINLQRYNIFVMKPFRVLAISFLLLNFHFSHAQNWSVSTNLGDMACLVTLNAEGSYAFSDHWSVDMGADYNPWTFSSGRHGQMQNRHLSVYAGPSLWLDRAFEGWRFSSRLQYSRYNAGGVLSGTSEEGNAYGAGIGFGYYFPVSSCLRFGLGASIWAGVKDFTVYECTRCGRIVNQGTGFFAGPDDVMISFCYVF